MNSLSTHVLDTSAGRPGAGVGIELEREAGGAWERVATAQTDTDGRAADLLAPGQLTPGQWLLRFDVGGYFAELGQESFYSSVDISFVVTDDGGHYHVPLLMSPWGYTTYRGS